ncbi:MAG TPA: DUF5916 domain-containing protein [Bacteroidales bacterium]|nr:DUF5916 domain-containing protein [Bacteroidales bacterium]
MILFNRCLFIIFLTVLIAINFPGSSSAQETVIPRLNEKIVFDGYMNEAVWNDLPPLTFVMHTPVFGKEPTEKSDVRIGYDNECLYVGARLFDDSPSEIMMTSRKRDEISAGNDWFQVIFDSFNDKENGVVFATNPLGLRTDYTILKDGIADMPELPFNVNWNTFWDVKTHVDDKGWSLEMRIPLSSLRYKDINGTVTMGLICVRSVPRLNETYISPAIPPNWGRFSFMRVSQAREVKFKDIRSKKPFYIAPYVIGGYQKQNLLNQAETAYYQDNDPKISGGLDLKYGLTNNLTLDVTLNTDFAQVESDDQRVNLTRFDLFYPEKRSFFQERSSIFAFDFEQGNSLFYSRRIGLSEDEPLPLYGGVRLTGMMNKWDVGILDMQTREFNSYKDSSHNLPSENFGIIRMRRNVINKNSYVGAIMSSRAGIDGSYNVSYGADAILKFFKDDYLNIKIAQVVTDSLHYNLFSVNPTAIYANWKRFRNEGLGYNFSYGRYGKDYDPGSGFHMHDNYSYYNGSLRYGWLCKEASALQSDGFQVTLMNYQSNLTGKTESSILSAGYYFNMKSGMFSYQGINRQFESVTDSFEFSDKACIPPGNYNFWMLEMHSMTASVKPFYIGMDLFAGSFYDGNRFSVMLAPSWNVSASVQLKAEYEYNRLRFSTRGQKFEGNVGRLRALWMMSTKLSFSSFIQYSNADHYTGVNLRFRYNPREGVDLYVVYNEGRNSDLNREVPHLPALSDRTFMVKFTYTILARK